MRREWKRRGRARESEIGRRKGRRDDQRGRDDRSGVISTEGIKRTEERLSARGFLKSFGNAFGGKKRINVWDELGRIWGERGRGV